jgi:hypothetical protein
MTAQRRGFNTAITRFWSFAAPAYDLGFLQRWVYRPAQDEVIAQLNAQGSRRIADIACGTGILADRIERELHPDDVYGVDMSEGMLAQARAALQEFYRVLAPGGVAAVSTISPRHQLPLLSDRRWNPAHNPSPSEMRELFEGAGFTVGEQHRVRRPAWTKIVSDLITVGTKAAATG